MPKARKSTRGNANTSDAMDAEGHEEVSILFVCFCLLSYSFSSSFVHFFTATSCRFNSSNSFNLVLCLT